ncbi:hypothetical protein V8C86DRAFT_2995286 [Haematococcus lacustris]
MQPCNLLCLCRCGSAMMTTTTSLPSPAGLVITPGLVVYFFPPLSGAAARRSSQERQPVNKVKSCLPSPPASP